MKQLTRWLFEVKSVDEEQRVITGMATTPTPDRVKDRLNPLGARFAKSIPLFLYHEATKAVGRAELGKPTGKGVPFTARIAKVTEAGTLRDRVDEAWQMVKYKLIDAVSVGFNPDEGQVKSNKLGGLDFDAFEILELSLVPIPMQPEAVIQHIKSIDARLLAASGHKQKDVIPPALGRTGSNPPNTKGNTMKTYTQEALTALRVAREQKAMRMEEMLGVKTEQEGKFNDEQRAEFDGLDSEIENLDDEIRVTQRHVNNIATARPVDTAKHGGAPYGFVKKQNDVDERFKGETGLKRALANIVAQKEVKMGNMVTPLQVVQERWGKTNPTLVSVMKAAVAGGGTDSGEWGAELAQADTRYTGDFIEYLYAKTAFDQLPLVNVPHNVVIKGQDGAFTGYFIGQSKAIKVSKGDFSSTTTVGYKAAGLTVVSNELLRDSSPSALDLCGTGLRNAIAQAVDSLFFSVTAVSAGVSPAGILNGVSIGSTNGGDAQSIMTDVKALWAPFITATNTEGRFVWITTPTTAVALSLMRNALGQTEFPGVTAMGGTFMGYPVIVSGNVGAGDIILMNCSEVWRIGDLGVSLSVSDSAMIEQDSAPQGATDTPVAASATLTSMFQEDSTAIRVIRPISWGKRRAGAVAYIGNAAWGSESS